MHCVRKWLLSVGSSNLSQPALINGVEWNLLSTNHEAEAHTQFKVEYSRLWEQASPLTSELVERYASRAKQYRRVHFLPEAEDQRESVSPRPWQIKALESLRKIRDVGCRRALVAVATGMGKTWLAAFDARQVGEQLERRAAATHAARQHAQRRAEVPLQLGQASPGSSLHSEVRGAAGRA